MVAVMKLTVVGAASAWSKTPGRSSSSYLVEHGSTSILLDLGQGSFSEVWRYTSFGDIAAVFVSHLHADHNVDLIPLRLWAKFENRGYAPALYAPAALRSLIGNYQANPDFFEDFAGESLSPQTFAVGDLRVTAGRVTHIPDAYGFRVAPASGEGPGIVYSGDCAEPDDLLELIKPGDLVLSEAAFGAGPQEVKIHMTAAQAADAAERGRAESLVLTHIEDRRDHSEARAVAEGVFEGEVHLARPGLELDIR
jgi:ribonuclease BN (tRNA processing enzyme)